MFSWFKKKPVPPPTPSVPAAAPAPAAGPPPAGKPRDLGHVIEVGFSNSERSWEEKVNLVDVAAKILRQQGHEVVCDQDKGTVDVQGLLVRPFLVNLHPLDEGGVQTVTAIRVSHPSFAGADVFEYQHSAGDNTEDAVRKGFTQWQQIDLVVLLDVLREKPETCTVMKMTFPATATSPPRARRVVLGPVGYMVQRPLPGVDAGDDAPSHASNCPCCFLTKSFEAFKPQLQSDGFHAIRFFAMRGPDGKASADCRINGMDCHEGMAALRQYVERWPDQGLEFRKQYIVIQPDSEPTTSKPRTELKNPKALKEWR